MLEHLEPSVLDRSNLAIDCVLPIATSVNELDVFVITLARSREPGHIVWFAGDEVDRFPSLDEYFQAMLDYNRLEVKELAK